MPMVPILLIFISIPNKTGFFPWWNSVWITWEYCTKTTYSWFKTENLKGTQPTTLAMKSACFGLQSGVLRELLHTSPAEDADSLP